MQMPDVKNTIVDPEKKVTYHIMAYRQLTREEMVLSVRQFLSQKRTSRVRRGSTITIVSIIGHSD